MDLATLASDSLRLVLTLALPALIASFAVSLLLSLFELLTSSHDPLLSFAPRLAAVGVALYSFRDQLSSELLHFTSSLFAQITTLAQ